MRFTVHIEAEHVSPVNKLCFQWAGQQYFLVLYGITCVYLHDAEVQKSLWRFHNLGHFIISYKMTKINRKQVH